MSNVEEMAKDIRDKSDDECTFYQSAEDVRSNLGPLWFDIIFPEGSYHVEDIY